MSSLQAIGLDAERSALAVELLRLNTQVHDRAVGLVGLPIPPDLTMQQLRVLGHVAKQPGISQQELGTLLGVSAPTASGLVERLVDKGLVVRADDPDDRRIRRLRPTETALDVMREMDSMFERALGVVVGELSVAELELLCRGAQAMIAALDRVRSHQQIGTVGDGS